MVILGTGIDLVALPRIAQSLQRFGVSFAAHVLTEPELAAMPEIQSLDQGQPAPRLVAYVAARFAAKEAASKAIGTGFAQGVTLKDFSVQTGDNGEPKLQFFGQAKQRAQALGVQKIHLSLSHEKAMACAVVTLEGIAPSTICEVCKADMLTTVSAADKACSADQPYMKTENLPLQTRPLPAPAHKGQAGRVLMMGGSEGLAGAPLLAGLGALRGGAGHVTLAAPASVLASLAMPPDFTTVSLPEKTKPAFKHNSAFPIANVWEAGHVSYLATVLKKCQAAATGMGTDCMPASFLQALLALPCKKQHAGMPPPIPATQGSPTRPPLVLDAGALRGLAATPELAQLLTPQDIATPHVGEAAALLFPHFSSPHNVQANRHAALEALMDIAPCVWVLKGAGADTPTLVGQKISPMQPAVFACPVFAPNLAVAGSGDVLAGLLAALCAQGYDAWEAATLGVCLHAQAGLLLQEQFPHRGNFASEIATMLPKAFAPVLAHAMANFLPSL